MDKEDMIIVFNIPHSFLEGVQSSNFFLFIAGIFPETEGRTYDLWSMQGHRQPKGNDYVDWPDC